MRTSLRSQYVKFILTKLITKVKRKEGDNLAYINGKWLDREERQERIDLLIESVRRLANKHTWE